MILNLFSSFGLIIDIVGVVCIFMYGLPSNVQNHSGSITVVETDKTKIERIKQNKKIKTRAYIGFVLLLIGFVFQLIGTNHIVTYNFHR